MAYVLRLEDLRAQTATAQLAAMLARANGMDATAPDWDDVRDRFDQALAATPEQAADPEKYELMQALGLR